MKKSIILLITLTTLSCGYNIKSDTEMVMEAYQIEQVQDELNEVKKQWIQLKDSIAMASIKESLRLERFKDSVEFTNLSRTMCWDKRDHRHSCEIYNNPLMKATNEAIIEQPDEAIIEQSDVAVND